MISQPTTSEKTTAWGKAIAFLAAIVFIAVPVICGVYNYVTMPPVGTQHTLKENRLGHAVVIYAAKPEAGYVEKRWNTVCTKAQGGTMTLTEHLFFRKDVNLFRQLTGIFPTGTYVYPAN